MALTFTPNNSSLPVEIPENKGIKYRIINVFKKEIELDELSIAGRDNQNQKQKPEDVVSLEFPLIKINNKFFSREEILSVVIDCTEFLPKITLSVGLINQTFLAKEMPKDGDIISIAIRNRSDILKIIRNDFVITNVYVAPHNTEIKSPSILTFYGELFVPGLKSQKNDFSFEGTSYYALQDFAKRFKLGFSSNEDNTDDKQIWIKGSMCGDIYVDSIVKRAWRDETSFFQAWIDLYYNLNFVNINKQLISAESEVDIAVLTSNVDKNTHYGADTNENVSISTPKVFSNFQTFRTTPFFITTWRPFNRSSAITFQIGTKMSCDMFEHNQNLYNNLNSTKFWSISNDPTYDQDKTNKMILLRGRASYVNDENNSDLKQANYSYVDLYEKSPWLGVQYTISNPNENNLQWDGNHHRNYHLARVKNLLNNKELDKLNLHIEVTGNNFNILRGDKTPVALIRTDLIENLQINPDINFNNALDLFYSGWYMVKGFKLKWTSDNEDSILSNFIHEFILTRREWPTPLPVEPIKTTNNV